MYGLKYAMNNIKIHTVLLFQFQSFLEDQGLKKEVIKLRLTHQNQALNKGKVILILSNFWDVGY